MIHLSPDTRRKRIARLLTLLGLVLILGNLAGLASTMMWGEMWITYVGPVPGPPYSKWQILLRLEVAAFALGFAFCLAAMAIHWRRLSRRDRGLCRRCGYNLTGLTQPRCPECGEPFNMELVNCLRRTGQS